MELEDELIGATISTIIPLEIINPRQQPLSTDDQGPTANACKVENSITTTNVQAIGKMVEVYTTASGR
jgi:hypothetical protein